MCSARLYRAGATHSPVWTPEGGAAALRGQAIRLSSPGVILEGLAAGRVDGHRLLAAGRRFPSGEVLWKG